MAEKWEPKVGDLVKVTHSRAWGPERGVPHMIMASHVTKVTKAGYVYVKWSMDKFQRTQDRQFVEHQTKRMGSRDWWVHFEPATAEEHAALPQTRDAGRAYCLPIKAEARRLRDVAVLAGAS